MSDEFIINVCLTGMVATKQQNQYLPVTAEEIAKDVEQCIELGASIFHVHARNDRQEPAWETESYEKVFQAIRNVSQDVIICATTSGRSTGRIKERVACLDAQPGPEMGSLTLGSVNYYKDGVLNTPDTILALIQAMTERGIKPEMEIFDIGMARTAARLMAEGILQPPCYANILLGNIASADASLEDLSAILKHIPDGVTWGVAGIGKSQLKANVLGVLFGHGVRVGLEDNLYLDTNKTPATNADLVRRVVQIGKLLGKSPAPIAQTRERLRL